jgi:hypothetical protein
VCLVIVSVFFPSSIPAHTRLPHDDTGTDILRPIVYIKRRIGYWSEARGRGLRGG